MALPRWDDKKGWVGGDSRTLYAFVDKRTGNVRVAPGGGPRGKVSGAGGDHADVRIATRAEGEKHWQDPLHSGWKTVGGLASDGDGGYRDCACRDCFDVAIGKRGALCHECKQAGCTPETAPGYSKLRATERECQRNDAYERSGDMDGLGALGRVSNGAIVGVALGALALWALWKKARS